jgi:hypothetical protein
MTGGPDGGRPLPTLLIVLIGSFVLMLLSGILYMAGLPEDLARALFLATVVMWFALGIAVLAKGRLDVRDLERERADRPGAAGECRRGRTRPGCRGRLRRDAPCLAQG